MKQRIFLLLLPCWLTASLLAAEDIVRVAHKDIPYYPESVLEKADDYQKERCMLDVSSPEGLQDLPVLVWFHGGGLAGGKKVTASRGYLRRNKIVLVDVNYRLFPKAKFPECLEDAAAAVAWTLDNIERYGGDPKKVFVGGSSAGGYLSGMIGLDPRWLGRYGKKPSQLKGLVLNTGQMTTHFRVRKELGYPQPEYMPIIDENAPLHYLSKDSPPILMTVGDRKLEWPARVVENEFMAHTLWAMGHPHVEFYENPGYGHNDLGRSPEIPVQTRNFLEKVLGEKL